MKKLMNFTTSIYDTERYADNGDLKSFYSGFGFDGVELMRGGEDKNGIVAPEDVIGIHMRYFNSWMDLWTGNKLRLLEEFESYTEVGEHYGGTSPDALTEAFKDNLKFAANMSPEYLVFHVSDCRLDEALDRRFHYGSEAVVDAAARLVDSFADSLSGTPLLLFENLWYPGLTMLEPKLTYRLLEKTKYPNTGVMLDIGHLLNTNTALRNIDEGTDYIHRVLDGYADLSFIKGIHLHQSLSGEYAENLMRTWTRGTGDYRARFLEALTHIFNIDTHVPFASERVNELVSRIQPEYLVLEHLSSDRAEHSRKIIEQMRYLTW